MAIEIWTRVKGYGDAYDVSSLGRVRSNSRKRKGRGGKPVMVTEKILSTNGLMGVGGGYPAVVLCGIDGKKSKYVHRLVAEAFVLNQRNLLEVNHIDGNKLNFSAENLEWVTRDENMRHAVVAGLIATGERHGRKTKPEAFYGN